MIGEDFIQEIHEARERQLVDAAFEQIRERTPTEAEREAMEPSVEWVEDPEELSMPDMDTLNTARKYPEGGVLRIDAEANPISTDLLRDAMALLYREHNVDPMAEGDFQFWTHSKQLSVLKRSTEYHQRMTTAQPGGGELRTVSIDGVPALGFDYFPKAAVLLLDPEAAFTLLEEEPDTLGRYGPGAGEAYDGGTMRFGLTDSRKVLRITGVQRP